MTTLARSTFEQRVRDVLAEDGGRTPVVLGLCGAGRTTVLRRLQQEWGSDRCQYVNVERTATTPERFLTGLVAGSPFTDARPVAAPAGPRRAFDAILAFLAGARRTDQGRATFLLDEVLEFRTFESFPGLRHALPELFSLIAESPNRFVLTSRYITRTARALAGASARFVTVPVPALDADEILQMLAERRGDATPGGVQPPPDTIGALARVVQHLSEGRAAYARALIDTMTSPDAQGCADPVAALASLLEPGGRLASFCSFSYELRLHRARGYGALKAILEILSEEQPLTLTEISQRLGRTPGSTKDYLSWLEDVDLIAVHQKRYRFRDSVLRVWVRLHCRPMPPRTEDIGREVQLYAATCLPDLTPAAAQ